MTHPRILVLATGLAAALLFVGCTKEPSEEASFAVLHPIGTKAFIKQANTFSAVDAASILAENGAGEYLCRVTAGTPVHSLRNDKGWVLVILEENSKKDGESESPLCPKGAIIHLDQAEFAMAVNYLVYVGRVQQEDRKAREELRQILKQEK